MKRLQCGFVSVCGVKEFGLFSGAVLSVTYSWLGPSYEHGARE